MGDVNGRAANHAAVRVSFVVCPSFHGATLLALLLNNHSKVSALGDTNPSREYDQICACREKVSECEFWQTVTDRLHTQRFSHLNTLLPNLPRPLANYGFEGDRIAISKSVRLNRAAGRVAAATADALTPVIWRRGSRAVTEYVQVWRELYCVVCDLHGTSVVIDGSKRSRKAALMARSLAGAVQVSVIHLVRDPRGFVSSSRRQDGEADARALSWLWAAQHNRIEELGSLMPYLRVRYEDLAVRPEAEMTSILAFLGIEAEPVVGPPRFPHKHHLMGNSMMFNFSGAVTANERWRTDLTPSEQVKVLQYAGEMADKCGYR